MLYSVIRLFSVPGASAVSQVRSKERRRQERKNGVGESNFSYGNKTIQLRIPIMSLQCLGSGVVSIFKNTWTNKSAECRTMVGGGVSGLEI
jgi:hypothetical protein